ncbi:MAG: ABC transporter ATP-binding protein [Planctomycetota bacterium]|nr:ABC transporter ATP-binding protein [Planctomycetota bacterium]MDP6739302.1 ABC transporter ATP-binding protein [Planctomycetota bacterium]MDP6939379.1 ABC transporter ATP-binding protein [Planctomycetota bacterium]
MTDAALLTAEAVRFAYPEGRFVAHVPRFRLGRGERVACVGSSGAGKTTLLHLLTGVLRAESGRIELNGATLTDLDEEARRSLRIRTVGMVFQQFALLDYLCVLDNILLPYLVSEALDLDAAAQERARSLAEATGIGALLDRKPGQLSQGERQRVALCRALVTEPPLVLADEPTGNLDSTRTDAAMDLLFEVCARHDSTLLVVTHDTRLLERFDRVLQLEECMEVTR